MRLTSKERRKFRTGRRHAWASDVISPSVIAKASELRDSFQSATPFKHLVIEDFLVPDIAERALTDFPAFDKTRAINEFGAVGRKSANPKLKDISSFYSDFYDWLFTDDFLSAMSAITGIPDLISDPSMFGGGTHENLDGQELDPHVDFNYIYRGDAHRRVNLLIYLNKEWDMAWGGAIEMHSNPRQPETNEIHTYNVTFNRAVMFETHEYSWHGFRKIRLPDGKKDTISRKCISIYLYTRTRPDHEIAGRHGTFYVPRPVEARIEAGQLLSEQDAQAIANGIRQRDAFIETYQKLEERLGRERAALESYAASLLEAVRLPTIGNVLQIRRLAGDVWYDAWTGPEFSFELEAVEDLTSIEIRGLIARDPAVPGISSLSLSTSEGEPMRLDVNGSEFCIVQSIHVKAGERFSYTLTCSSTFNPSKTGVGSDQRDLSMMISSVRFR